jgi:O-acetylhomoserine/O-acetylserine sulfhydrylase-like pyridoxal-dependent enzyme
MAAINALVTAVCKVGDNVVVGLNMYAGTLAYFGSVAPGHGIEVSWVDVSDPRVVRDSIRPQTKVRV